MGTDSSGPSMMSTTSVCDNCGGIDYVDDTIQGDRICTTCGFVLQEHLIDTEPEWRRFSDQTSDPDRCGGPSNPFLSNAMGTLIGSTTAASTLQKTQQIMDSDSTDRLILDHIRCVEDILARMRYAEGERAIHDRAISLLAAMRRNGKRSNVHNHAAMAAVAVWFA